MSDQEKHKAHIFYVDSRFERLARRPGGPAREQALTQAQSQVEGLKDNFAEWLDEQYQQLRTALAQIESEPTDAASLDEADRICSQIRDVGATVGYLLVTFVAGSLCSIVEALKGGAAYDKDAVDCHINALLLVRTDSYRNLRPDEVPEMTAGLRRVVALSRSGSGRKEN